jgi:UDP-N-acetylglucosamine--N-acetylmuramyl-(pentapeptide) pyrophosphoryl-undecaprenol N-acetylglucosamine transferase
MELKKFVVTGGGTGGHVYPGLAVARAVLAQKPNVDIVWIGSSQGMEKKLVPKEGFRLVEIPVGKLNMTGASLLSRIRTILGLPLAMIECWRQLRNLRPDCVLGVGGFVSGPVTLVAALMGIPTAIWEPNAHPGLTNRWLSPFVKRIFLVFEEAAPLLRNRDRIQRVGLPIRKEIEALSLKQKNFLDHDRLHVLVFCGSQGARTVNSILKKAFTERASDFSKFEIRHQTGVQDFSDCQQAYRDLNFITAYEYLEDMAQHLDWADVVVCRSGTGSVFEVAACRKPAIFIPLPWAADDHQKKNALALVQDEAACLILQKDLTAEALLSALEKFRNNPRAAMVMGQKAHRFYTPRAAEVMAEAMIEGLAQKKA